MTGGADVGQSGGGSRARDRGQAVPGDLERVTLRATFGAELARRRNDRGLTQQALADAAGMRRQMVDMLENGRRRPSTVSTWRLARALRPRGSVRDKVALDEQLRRLAGASLAYARTRPHVARERVRAELRAEAGDGPVAGDHYETLGGLAVMELGRMATGAGHSNRSVAGESPVV